MHITTEQQDVQEVLFSAEQIAQRVEQMAAELSAQYEGKRPLMVCTLKGSAIFFADLCRAMKCHIEMDFIAVSSYGAQTTTSGVVRILKDLDADLSQRHVIIVEDIVDSGVTLAHLKKLFSARGCASVKTVALLDKPAAHAPELCADYVGFSIGNAFVVGYGLDYAQYYRQLPYIGILSPDAYAD